MSFSLSTQCHMSFTFLNELPSPAEIKQNYPLSDKLKALKKEVRDEAIETHREIADAIAAHDAVRAHDAMYLHLIYNRKHIKSTN